MALWLMVQVNNCVTMQGIYPTVFMLNEKEQTGWPNIYGHLHPSASKDFNYKTIQLENMVTSNQAAKCTCT